MALTKVNTGGLALDAVDNTILKLDDDYALTGAVTGATPITHLDQWRLTTNFTGGAEPLGSNLERVDTTGQPTIGSAMTFSSGIFTFPVTGKWLVSANWVHYLSGSSRYQSHYISVTQNNSDYVIFANMNTFIAHAESDNTYTNGSHSTTVDVTNTSNIKCRFELYLSNSSVGTVGNTAHNSTFFTFIRLGDT